MSDLSELARLTKQNETEHLQRHLRLSEAVRIGASRHPQANHYFRNGGTCFWGAAAVGYGATDDQIVSHASKLHREHMSIDGWFWCKPMARSDSGEPRESIADWLASQGY